MAADLVQPRLSLAKAAHTSLTADGGRSPDGVHGHVPRHVAASWRRSSDAGVQPHLITPPYDPEIDFGSRLVRFAQPVVQHLCEQVADLPGSVALTDARGRLVFRRDNSSPIGRMLDRVYFAPGFDYAEAAVGTNGVGTALEMGEAVHIVGAEHYVEELQKFACAGAPIRNPLNGRIEGVLDLSCLSDQSTPVMRSLVGFAARQIERSMLLDRDPRQQALFEAYTQAEARSKQPVMAVGPRVVLANAALQALLEVWDQQVLQDHMRFLMSRHLTVDDHLELPSGRRVRLHGARIQVGAAIAGMVGKVSTATGSVSRIASPVCATVAVTSRASESGAGHSQVPSWRAAAATVEEAMRSATPLLVLGEPGSGRRTLLATTLRRSDPTSRITVLGVDEIDAAPGEAAARLREMPSTPTLLVLRDVDRLSPHALTSLADTLAAAVNSRPAKALVAATASAAVAESGTHQQRLLALFGASTTVPALRYRRADLPGLVDGLLADLAPHRQVTLSPDAWRVVLGYDWPGNIREVKHALAAALTRRPVGVIQASDLPAYCQSAPRTALRLVDQAERDTIVATLRQVGGNRVAAAAALGLARSTLYRKIRQYGITV